MKNFSSKITAGKKIPHSLFISLCFPLGHPNGNSLQHACCLTGVLGMEHMPLFSPLNSFFLSLPRREMTCMYVGISISLTFIKMFFPLKKILTFASCLVLHVKSLQTVFSCLSASFVIFVESQEACCTGE